MDKENIIGTPEKSLKDTLSYFETAIKDILIGMDYETAFIFLDKFSKKLDKVSRDMRKMKIDYE